MQPNSTNTPVWLTYAWLDNAEQDVDYIAQELRRLGLNVQLDRWNLERPANGLT